MPVDFHPHDGEAVVEACDVGIARAFSFGADVECCRNLHSGVHEQQRGGFGGAEAGKLFDYHMCQFTAKLDSAKRGHAKAPAGEVAGAFWGIDAPTV